MPNRNSNIYDLVTLSKNSISATDFLQLANSDSGRYSKVAMSTLFPSMATAGSTSEDLFVSVTNKNQLNFKGIKSADTGVLTVTTLSNNIILTALEAGIDLSLCNNVTSAFLTAVDFTSIVTGECPVTNGGTGLSSIVKGAILYADEADSIKATSALATNGQILIGNATTGIPSIASITAGTNIAVVAGAGTITLNANQTNAEANFDLRNGADSTTYNIDTNNGEGYISGNGADGGLTVDNSARAYIGANGTKVFSEILTLAGNLRFTGASTIKPTAVASSAAGAALTVESGVAVNGAAGHLNINGGEATGSGAAGSIILTSGKSASGTDGNIQLKTHTAGGTATAGLTIAGDTQNVTIDTGDLVMSTGNIYMRGSSNPNIIKYQGTPADAGDNTDAVTAAQILKGIVTVNPGADRSKAVDASANLISGLSLNTDQDSFDFVFINLGEDSENRDITLTAGTDVTLVGSMHISSPDTADASIASGSAQFRIRRTGSAAVTLYRIA
tara:strand:- start:3940 stop:5451 length:1512 start_codon:yes stop_codon:yes gene_type:complete